jgi:N-acetylglucosamine malate deacetylase 1
MNVLVVAPHPDDESIGCGGAIALHARMGDRVRVLFLTSGERGLPELSHEEATSKREAEAREACKLLGVLGWNFVGLPDGDLARHLPECIEAIEMAVKLSSVSMVYAPHALEAHADHAATFGAVCSLACRSASVEFRYYEVWTPLAAPRLAISIDNVLARKYAAIRCYKSQLVGGSMSKRFDIASAALARFRSIIPGVEGESCNYAEVFG